MGRVKKVSKKKKSAKPKDKIAEIRKANLEERIKYIARSTNRLFELIRQNAPYVILRNEVRLSYGRMLTMLQEYDRQQFIEEAELKNLMMALGFGKD